MDILKDFDNDTAIQLIESVYLYLLDKHSLPLKKLTFNVRVPFSAIYHFLRKAPGKQIGKLDGLPLSAEVKKALKEKLYLLYAQNYHKIGLLSNYPVSNTQAITEQEAQARNFVQCSWKINVVLSTNYLNKVLRPEIVIELERGDGAKVKMVVTVEKFDELRRQVAYLLRYTQQIECIRYLNI